MKNKVTYSAIAILFLIFALIQYNDPDPLLWMLIYFSVSIIAVLKIYLRQVNYKPLIITLIIILGLFALTFIPSFIEYLSQPNKAELFGGMTYKKPWIEETREFLGLLLTIGALVYLLKDSPKKKPQNRKRKK